MRFQPSLLKKALILIAVPLAFELLLLGTLNHLLDTAEREARQAEHIEKVIALAKEVMQNFYNVGFAYIAYDARTVPYFKKHLVTECARIKPAIEALRGEVKDNPAYLNTVVAIDDEISKMLQIVYENVQLIEAGGRMNVMEALRMQQQLDRMVAALDRIIVSEQEKQKNLKKQGMSGAQKAEQYKALVRMALLAGTIVSILLALLLAIVFHQGTTRRLGALMVNMSRFKEHEPLRPVLAGDDEIARIDRVFHQMADALTQAARQKQEFVDMISHDLRTPLSAVQAALAVLSTGSWGQLNEKGLKKVSTAEDNIRRSIGLINNLLDLERMESGTFDLSVRTYQLSPILESCADSVSQLAERKNIAVRTATTDAVVEVDEGRISQVILNLLGNAVKFSPPESEIKIDAIEKGRLIEVRVTDMGPGIPPDHKKLIFERFHQVPGDEEAKAQGTGLGLAICRLIVEAHGGTIGVDSEVGKGSTFWFSVPLSDQPERDSK